MAEFHVDAQPCEFPVPEKVGRGTFIIKPENVIQRLDIRRVIVRPRDRPV